ncbi:hypothetical protein LSAT2_000679, partial [Lamellibrachia satsuma]
EKLIEQGVKLLSCNRKIHPYSSPPIRVHQLIRSNITLEDGNEIEADYLAIEGTATPLLGKATAESLGLLKHRLMFGRDPRTKLPEAVPELHPDDQVVRENDRAAKGNIKSYADTKARAKPSLIAIGDVVLMRQRKTGKLSTPFHPRPLVVTSR